MLHSKIQQLLQLEMKMCPIFAGGVCQTKAAFSSCCKTAEILGVQRISALMFVLVISMMKLLVWSEGVHRRSGVEWKVNWSSVRAVTLVHIRVSDCWAVNVCRMQRFAVSAGNGAWRLRVPAG